MDLRFKIINQKAGFRRGMHGGQIVRFLTVRRANDVLAKALALHRSGEGIKVRSLPASRLAWFISGMAATLGVLFLVLLVINSRHPEVSTYEYWGAHAVTTIVFPAVGALIVSRHPRNALGWIFCMIGLTHGLGGFASEYATYALIVEPGSMPGAATAAWLGTWVADIGYFSLPIVPLLFPNGQPLFPRCWPLVWLAAGAIGGATISLALMPGPLATHPSVENPAGIEGTQSAIEFSLFAAGSILGVTFLVGITSLAVRYRRSLGAERQQLKWFTYAVALIPFTLLGNSLFPEWSWLIGGVGASLMPLAIGIAILKYRLYDIDLIINRTIVYGALTAWVIGIYVLLVGYLAQILRTGDNLAISLVATGVVAVLFAPLRDRLQRAVNRLLYGERDDPYGVLSRLGRRLKATIEPDAVLPTIVETVAGALKLPYAAMALARDDGFETVAEYGTPRGEPLVLPLAHGTETIGALILAPRAPGESFDAKDRQLLDDLVRQSEVAVQSVRLTHDLQRSRERLVNAREEERRRLRRDLHDGLGPRLATLTLKLDAARNQLTQQPAVAAELLTELKAEAQSAIADIRRLVYDLRPPALDDLGLIPAIREQATSYSQNGLHVVVEAPERLPPLPAAVEVAAYRIIQEALTNVVRHAGARSCQIRLSIGNDLHVEITDDGAGLPDTVRSGVGLHSMRERSVELGGTCSVESLRNGGTRVFATLPLPKLEARP